MKILFITIVLFSGLFCAEAVSGQVTPDVWSKRIYQREMLKIVGNGAVNRVLINKRQGVSSAQAAKKVLTAAGPTSFKFNDNYILPGVALKEFQGTQQEKAAVAESVKTSIDIYRNTARTDGFAANDLAFSLANNFFQNYFAHVNIDCGGNGEYSFKKQSGCQKTNKLSQTSFKTDSAVVEQFRAVLMDNPEVSRMSDSDKQLMAESFAVKTYLFLKQYHAAMDSNNSAALRDAKLEADKNLELLLGSPADRVTLTVSGIQIK